MPNYTNYKKPILDEIMSEYPGLDRIMVEKVYKIVLSAIHKSYKANKCLCYNKKCDKRMV